MPKKKPWTLLSECEREKMLSELDYMVSYWEREAARQTKALAVKQCTNRRLRSLKLAADIRRGA